jgi:ATP-binding cassette, subfamily C (CFTR/MRP), member 1
MRHLDLEAKTPLYTQFSETAAGALHIRAFGWQSSVMDQSLRLLDHSQKPYYYLYCIQRWLNLVLEMYVMVIAVVLVTLALKLPHSTSEAAIGLSLLHVISFGSGMASLIGAWTRMETSLGAIARLRDFLDETPVEAEPRVERIMTADWPTQGRIELRNVTARYKYV